MHNSCCSIFVFVFWGGFCSLCSESRVEERREASVVNINRRRVQEAPVSVCSLACCLSSRRTSTCGFPPRPRASVPPHTHTHTQGPLHTHCGGVAARGRRSVDVRSTRRSSVLTGVGPDTPPSPHPPPSPNDQPIDSRLPSALTNQIDVRVIDRSK